ncbi:Asp23/Gls24 family envelope stress response protein [Christensenella timonensis]|uniref:Asp23/Gls24 family envelope stress response protein n=1 Tax=Christensenella timonensis TaxID=1816678 RepID=UPI000832718B|nr:Asp23/Gls24 family envelope stress response protein [Christensenella timonensis]
MADTNLSTQDTTAIKKESNGTITFANEVIATIAGLAAVDIPGVAGMSGGFVDGITELVGRKNLSKGIKVEVGTEEVAVDIAIVVEYGMPVPEIAQNIQMSVMKAVETMTGLKVVEVNVNVQGIKFKEQSTRTAEPKDKDKEKEAKPVKAPRVK